MPQNPNAHFDQTVLDQIEHSPVGAVPGTPTYQDALKRLGSAHQVFAHADFKDGYVTVRALGRLASFHANNLEELIAGRIGAEALESNTSIFERYVHSLPPERRAKAESHRLKVVGRPIHHRKHEGTVIHDPVHSLFLVPGAGAHPGLPGNYLYGSVYETGAPAHPWAVTLHDNDDGVSSFSAPTLQEGLLKLQEVLASAPFKMDELAALGFQAQ
jgi:hypothetical protein